MSDLEPAYPGLDILQALDRATNYNALLVDLILRTSRGRRRMLDFGAGIGTFSRPLRAQGIDVVCVESDVQLAKALIRDGFTTFRDLDEVPDDSFEFIFTLNVLEHIQDDRACVNRLRTKLKQEGTLLVYVPAFNCLWTSLDDKIKHCRRYRRSELERLVCSAGLSVLESRYVDSLGFFAALGFKIFGNKNGELGADSISFYDRYVVPPSRALTPLFGRTFGKNVYVVASKD